MSQSPADPRQPIDPLCWMLAAWVSGLTFLRWWQPTEGTIQGDTLGLVLGWFVAFALLGWTGLRGERWVIRLDRLQWSILLLAGGHLLSGSMILVTSGDKRAALNLMWEWLALLITFPLLRWVLGTSSARREWTVIALSAVITLSAYGLIQRIFIYPQTIAEYRQVREELDAAERAAVDSGNAGPSYQTRALIQSLQTKLLKQGLQPQMLTGSSRVMFEGRLLHSTEALGRFALANTFAGLLLVWFVILLLQTFTQIQIELRPHPDSLPVATAAIPDSSGLRARRYGKFAVLLFCVGVVGYALLLTKSRTAYLATITSLCCWSLLVGLRSRPRGRQILVWTIAGLAVVFVLIVIAGLTGGLDRLVFAEAPKSLQYRLEYWWSSLQVIGESPILGIGPGQFRQHYLVHKLPRSSEEIADPHNLILDVWANGGLLALIGLIWMMVELFRKGLTSKTFASRTGLMTPNVRATGAGHETRTSEQISIGASVREAGVIAKPIKKILKPAIPHSTATERIAGGTSSVTQFEATGWTNPLRIGALGSLLIFWLMGGALETTLLIFVAGWAICIALLDDILRGRSPNAACWMAAGCGLFVHLLGAGGIGMPAITQLFVLIAIFSQFTNIEADIEDEAQRELAPPEASPSQMPPSGTQPPREANSPGEGSWKNGSQETATSGNRATAGTAGGASKWVSGAAAILGLGLFAACFVTAAQPVWLSFAALEQGDLTNSQQKREQYCRQAATADPLLAEPWEKLASSAFGKWRQAQKPDPQDVQAAIASQLAAIERNPLGYHGYRTLGEIHAARAVETNSPQDQQLAVEAFQVALKRYPYHAELHAVAAEALFRIGERELAASAAIQALQQDDINHAAQHTDKYLSKEMRSRIEEIRLR